MSVASSIAGGGSSGSSSDSLKAGSGTAITDNKVVRGDTPSGLQGSGVTISDADAVSGVTQLDVDNLRSDGNTLSTTNANGDLNLTPNGTGAVVVPNGTVVAPSLRFTDDGAMKTGFVGSAGHLVGFVSGGNHRLSLDGNSGHLCFQSGGQLRWSSGSDPTTGYDLNFFRSGVSEGTFGTTAGGITGIMQGRVVEASTAGSGSPNLLAAGESRKLLTNEGAGAENYHTLPAAVAGLGYAFYCQSVNGIRVVAAAGDTIRLGPSVSATGGFVRSEVIGSALILNAINATEWVALSIIDTWTIDS